MAFITVSEARDVGFKSIYDELVDQIVAINKKYGQSNRDAYPTPQWISGKLQQLPMIDSMEDSLNRGTVQDTSLAAEYERSIALKDILQKYKMIERDGKRYKKTDMGSRFIQQLSNSFLTWKEKSKQMRELSDQENREWYNSLNAEDKKMVDLYSELSARDYAFLMGLLDRQESKSNYSNVVDTAVKKNPDKIERLQSMGLINKDYSLNLPIIKDLLSFLDDKTFARLKGFNKDIAYITQRISADRALLKNFLDRQMDRTSHRRSDFVATSDDVVDKLTTREKQMLVNNKFSPEVRTKLEKLNILEPEGSLTDLGKFIQQVLTSGRDVDSLAKSGEKPTQYSRLKKSEIDTPNKSERKNQKAASRAGTFKQFLTRR